MNEFLINAKYVIDNTELDINFDNTKLEKYIKMVNDASMIEMLGKPLLNKFKEYNDDTDEASEIQLETLNDVKTYFAFKVYYEIVCSGGIKVVNKGMSDDSSADEAKIIRLKTHIKETYLDVYRNRIKTNLENYVGEFPEKIDTVTAPSKSTGSFYIPKRTKKYLGI